MAIDKSKPQLTSGESGHQEGTRQNQQGFCQSGARSSQQAKSDANRNERRADQQKRSSKKMKIDGLYIVMYHSLATDTYREHYSIWQILNDALRA
jgi:radical SAM superfamily enzyme